MSNAVAFLETRRVMYSMRVSIVVPTHNRRDLLEATLRYLLEQEQKDSVELEIIIVDDDSNDGTYELVSDYKAKSDTIIYVLHSRTKLKTSCPASVRNLGIQRSCGEIVILLDCGVLIPPCFVSRVVERYLTFPDQVLIHYTVGLSTPPNEHNQQQLAILSPQNLFREVQRLSRDPEWIDMREGLFDLVNDQLDHLPAPWTLAWTCAMSIPKDLLEKVNGFDETFQDWGGEDTDLGFRLYQYGTSFVATRDCIAFHLPHKKSPLAERITTNSNNRRKTHKKAFLLDTELFCYYSGLEYNQVLLYYKHLVAMNTIPCYSSRTLVTIKNMLLNDALQTLLIGTDCKFMAEGLPTTHNFVHNISTWKHFCQWFPDREIRYLLGCDTPYTENYFTVVLLTDFIRLLPKVIQSDLFKELHRIGQHVFFLYTETYVPPSYQVDGCRWSSLDEITHILDAVQLQAVLIKEVNGTSILKVQSLWHALEI